MTDASELERQNAELRKQLEAAQAAPAGGFMGALSLIGEVWGMIPRPLKVAVALIVVAGLGFEVFQKVEQTALQTETMRAAKAQAEADASKAEAQSHAATFNINRAPGGGAQPAPAADAATQETDKKIEKARADAKRERIEKAKEQQESQGDAKP